MQAPLINIGRPPIWCVGRSYTAPLGELSDLAGANGMRILLMAGAGKVPAGHAGREQVLRVCM